MSNANLTIAISIRFFHQHIHVEVQFLLASFLIYGRLEFSSILSS